MNKICVFCGSSSGTQKSVEEATHRLGQALVKRSLGLVYGGANVGLMGAIADSVLEAGGEVVGILPEFLQGKELAHAHLTELIIVDSMHKRKMMMNELSDGVIALPGGFGTIEELFEILTWGQLGLHQQPVGLLNIDGFFDSLLDFVQNMVDKGFLKAANKDMLLVCDDVEVLLDMMENYKAPIEGKWIAKATS